MRMVRSGIGAVVLFASLAALVGAARDAGAQTAPADTAALITRPPNAWLALGEITLTNGIVWTYNRYIREGGGEGFKIGWGSWNEAIENGFDWDPNNFSTNQYAHPYHGSLYYNAARSNGFDYWSSMGFAFAGSFQWEFFGESRHPSFNDWINTSVGGTALGEMTHRLATTVRDNSASGKSRFWRELGGFAIDPVGGFTRFVKGDLTRVQANPEGRFPSDVSVRLRAGSRTVYEDRIGNADTTGAVFDFGFYYGDAFEEDFQHPFDVFEGNLQLNTNDRNTLGRVQVIGLLARTELEGNAHARHVLGAFQHYDYLNNRAFELGGQAFSAGLLSRFGEHDSPYRVNTAIHVGVMPLGATKSDYENETARSYDYGPGFGAAFRGRLMRHDVEMLRLGYAEYYIHSVNGNRADHFLALLSLGASLPIGRTTAIGADYLLYTADRNYADFPDVYQRSPQLQITVQTRL